MKDILNSIKNNRKAFDLSMVIGVFFGMSAMIYFIKNSLAAFIEIDDFSSHVLSQASAHNLDIASRISGYYRYIFLAIFISSIIGIILFNILKNKFEYEKKAYKFLYNISIIGILSVMVSLLLNYEAIQLIFVIIIFMVPILLTLIYLLFEKNRYRDFDMIFFSVSMALVLATFIKVNLDKIGFVGMIGTLLYIAFICFFSLAIFLLSQTRLSKYKGKITFASIPLLFSGIVQCFMLEGLNVINLTKNITLDISFYMYWAIIIACIVLFSIIFIFSKKANAKELIYKLYMPVTILFLALIIAQPARFAGASGEFFETANHGISLDHFFKYGSIPIIETFDAHMLSNQLFGYLYGLINGYEVWAVMLYNTLIIPIQYLIIYYLLTRMLGKKTAFFFVLGFPILRMVFYHMFIYCAILYFAVEKLLYNNTKKNRIIFCLVCFILCIFRLDVGFASVVAALVAYIAFNFSKEKFRNIVDLIITGAIFVVIIGVVYILVCILKDISPLSRLSEILSAAGSSQNWGYAQTGDKATVVYNLLYYAMPLLLAGLTFWIINRYIIFGDKNNLSKNGLLMFIFFTVFYYMNLSRGIVRHSFIENSNAWYIISTSFIALMALSVIEKKKNIKVFVSVICLAVLVLGVAYPSFNDKEKPLQHLYYGNKNIVLLAYDSSAYKEQYTSAEAMNGSRVKGENIAQVGEFKKLLDTVLDEDQSYIDLASLNMFYALTDRKSPTFVNQSPMMISGDDMQRKAIERFSKQDLPIAILPIGEAYDIGFGSSIDAMHTDYKYYLLFEYVYKNYSPIVRMNGFDVYCLKDKKQDYADMLGFDYEFIETNVEVDNVRLAHTALLWGENDGDEKIASAPLLDSKLTTEGFISNQPLPVAQPMSLVFEMDAKNSGVGVVRLISCNFNVAQFEYFIEQGKHTYAIRLSSDLNFWDLRTDALVFESGQVVDISKMCLMSDDGQYFDVYK